jgi:Uma2 family endonuclease
VDEVTDQTEIRRYKFTAEQYYKMAEVGILAWGNREELIRGVVLDPAPLVRNRCHPLLKGGVTRFLNELEGTPEEFEGRIHKYTAEEYQEMGKAGILTKDDRVELIDGEIVQMPPIGSSHQETVDTVNEMFVFRFAPVARVRIQGPVRFADSSEPEPDIMLLERRTGSYRSSHPQPRNVLLAVEVSDSTLRSDRAVKVPYYAHYGIQEVWLVNLPEDTVDVYRNPEGSSYQEITRLHRGETVSPLAFPDVTLDIGDLLG